MTGGRQDQTRAIAASALITAEGFVAQPLILVDHDRIEAVTTQSAMGAPANTLYLHGATLSTGFVDVHVHGAGGRDVMEATPDALRTVARTLAQHGTTRFLATTVTATVDRTLQALSHIARHMSEERRDGEAEITGIHLEGPFIAHARRGVHPEGDLQPPSIALFDRFHQAAEGHIRLMTIAPELPGATDLIAYATSRGVRVSLGHSDALASEARAGIAAGAVSATHTFNAMRGLTQREPGMLGVALDERRLYAELICDGIHTSPEAVRLWLTMKGADYAMLVTDGMAATGMPDGAYMLGDIAVTVRNGVALHEGALAGSVLTMERAVANVQRFTGIDLSLAVKLATYTPAAMLGLPEELAAGSSADFNIFNAAGERIGTILRGRMLSV